MSTVSSGSLRIESLDGLLQLRPFPAAATRLMIACESETADVRTIAETVKCDPCLSLRLLQIANSPLYGFSGQIRSVDSAAVILGLRALKDLAISTAVADVFAQGSATTGAARNELWQHSLACGTTARVLGKFSRIVNPDEAFLAGVVHDVGKLFLLDHRPDTYAGMVCSINPANTVSLENDMFGIAHTEVGHQCGQNWGLPDEINDVISFHHDPDAADFGGALVDVIAASNRLAKLWNDGNSDPDTACSSQILNDAGMDFSPEEISDLRQSVRTSLEALCHIGQ